MEVKLLIPSIYCESVIQVNHYTLTDYRAGVLLCYYHSGLQRAVLPPLNKRSRGSCPLVPAPLAVFEKIYIYQHGVLMVIRAFVAQQGRRQKDFQRGQQKKKRKVALLSLFQGGNGKRPKNSKKKLKNSTFKLIYICIVYDNPGATTPSLPLQTLMPHSQKTWVQPSSSQTKRLKKLVFTVSLLD